MTNDSGLVVTSHEYLPFGEDWITEGDTKNAPKYNSQELDKESGYYFYNARHYDPEIARFVTADTVIDGEGNTQGWNRYAYVHNNPIRYKDPTGHFLTSDALKAMNGTNGQNGIDAIRGSSPSSPAAMKADASKLVNNMFDKAVKDCKNLTGGARLKGVVENLTKQFESVKYKNEDQLAYTYGALMQRMGKEFGAGPNHIGYGKTPGVPLYDLQTGKLSQKDSIDCTFYQTLGINILGLTKPGGENVNERLTSKYTYADSSYVNGPKNFMDNKSIFRKVSSSSDLTGTIGVIAENKYTDHAFTSLNSDSSSISESAGGAGIRNISKSSHRGEVQNYQDKASYYRLRLPDWKKE